MHVSKAYVYIMDKLKAKIMKKKTQETKWNGRTILLQSNFRMHFTMNKKKKRNLKLIKLNVVVVAGAKWFGKNNCNRNMYQTTVNTLLWKFNGNIYQKNKFVIRSFHSLL